MAKSKYSLSEAQIAKRIKEGRGSGSGADYSPWVRVDEVPSLGRSRQVYSHLTKRIHHLLSDLEFAVFLLLDNNPFVTDIREQFPLIRDDTRDIARENNLPHPANNGVDTVMSSDFLVDLTFPPKIFLKGFLRWLVISTAIIFTIFAVKLGLDEKLTVQHFSLVSWQASKFILFFSSLSGAVDVFLYWLKARENKEKA